MVSLVARATRGYLAESFVSDCIICENACPLFTRVPSESQDFLFFFCISLSLSFSLSFSFRGLLQNSPTLRFLMNG